VPGFTPDQHPLIVSEFGGIALFVDRTPGWGHSRVNDAEDLALAYEGLMRALHACRGTAGFCYTQLTDTFQERNGLLTAAREPKAAIARLADATRGKRKSVAMDVDPEV
jgi:hypothetical protein